MLLLKEGKKGGVSSEVDDSPQCTHMNSIETKVPNTEGCEECLELGQEWLHLRVCATCGHVGCCDSSRGKHSTRHHRATSHPIIRSNEPGESWYWCYPDKMTIEPAEE